jgi:hypothetical protein
VLLPAEDGAATLPLNLVCVAVRCRDEPAAAWLDGTAELLAAGGIGLDVRAIVDLTELAHVSLAEVTEPHETPWGTSARLARAAAGLGDPHAVDLFVVDELPPGVGGWSLGAPGVPVAGTPYSGVIVERGADDVTARVAAHELAHYLGLRHVVDRSASGVAYPDRLDDTSPRAYNLMDDGTRLTADQAYVLRRSAVLR